MPFAKKSLGQNFLNSPHALVAIINAGQVTKNDQVLEIGPGRGALTKALLATGAHVTAIEKDETLAEGLKVKFSGEIDTKQLEIITGDVLDYVPPKSGYKLIANIPYYLTGQIIRQFLETKNQPTLAVLMLQKEVAERIVARDSKESILSISVKAYGTPKYIKTVPAGAFIPKPNVDSAILLIDNISKNFFTNFSEEKFFELVKKGFAQKRKMLRSNLPDGKNLLTACQLKETARAEDLKLDDWSELTKRYAEK